LMSAHSRHRLRRTIRATHKFHQRGLLKRAHHAVMAVRDIAARILGQAGVGEILVDRTVRDLVIGSGTGFDDRGSVELRGVPGTWQLLAVDRHGARAGSAEAELASAPTPGPQAGMRRSDRAVAAMARRTPWMLRGMGRLAPAIGRR
jgi:hypothetical protein